MQWMPLCRSVGVSAGGWLQHNLLAQSGYQTTQHSSSLVVLSIQRWAWFATLHVGVELRRAETKKDLAVQADSMLG